MPSAEERIEGIDHKDPSAAELGTNEDISGRGFATLGQMWIIRGVYANLANVGGLVMSLLAGIRTRVLGDSFVLEA